MKPILTRTHDVDIIGKIDFVGKYEYLVFPVGYKIINGERVPLSDEDCRRDAEMLQDSMR